MKQLVRTAVSAALLAISAIPAGAWGQKGHDVVCTIAQRHLTRKASAKISDLLDGKSIVYWANWMDNASHTPEYAYTKTWHYKNVDAGQTLETAQSNPSGDVLTAINAQVAALRSGTLNKEAAALALKMIIHFTGDLHCPMHMGHLSDLGGNKVQVRYFNTGKNLHGVWDRDLVESAHNWTHTEWAVELDRVSRRQFRELGAGTPEDWARQTLAIVSDIYAATPSGARIQYDYINEWTPVIEQQLLLAGLRLASLLNDIFK